MKRLNRICAALTALIVGGYLVGMVVTGVTQHRATKECRTMGYVGATAFGTWAWCIVQYRTDSTVALAHARRRVSKSEGQ